MTDTQRLADAILRNSFPMFFKRVFRTTEPGIPFVDNWHYQVMAAALQRVMNGEVLRLIINVPPRSGKSLMATVSWPMFLLGRDPTLRIICISHTEDLARKFSVDRRTIASSPWYQRMFPATRFGPRPRDLELTTTQRGSCYAAGVGGAILGRGAEIIIVDDPIKPIDALSKAERRRVAEFYDNTLLTRLNHKQSGGIVIVMQRLHEDDLVGHVRERDDGELLSLPALAVEPATYLLSDNPNDVYCRAAGEVLQPEREPQHILEQIRRAQGSLLFEAQYQQAPAPAGGNMIRREWLRYYDGADRPTEFHRIIASWDTASTTGENSDWSVGTVWGALGLDYYLLDRVRGKFEAPDLRAEIEELSLHWHANATYIEQTQLGHALVQDMRRTARVRPILHEPKFDKEARLMAQSARFQAGQVYLPREAAWLAEYESELLAFPNGRNDDQVDSTSQALLILTARQAPPPQLERRRDPERRNPERRNPERRNIERRNPERRDIERR